MGEIVFTFREYRTGQRFGTYNQESRNYAVGSILQYRFTDHISVVVNPLYRRLGSS